MIVSRGEATSPEILLCIQYPAVGRKFDTEESGARGKMEVGGRGRGGRGEGGEK